LCIFGAGTSWHHPPQGRSTAADQHFQQSIRRCVNSLALRLPADCQLQAGSRQGDPIEIFVGSDGPLRLEPLRQLDPTPLASKLTALQATMPLTPSVI
jgi:antitoxin component of MazEF toxin-antitoxin module